MVEFAAVLRTAGFGVPDRIATCRPRALALVAWVVSTTGLDTTSSTLKVTALVGQCLAGKTQPEQTGDQLIRTASGAPAQQQQRCGRGMSL